MEKTGITITKRKDGRYVGKFIAEYADNGKAQYHYVYGKTYEEAENKVMIGREIASQFLSGRYIKVGKVYREWLNAMVNRVKESTLANYRNKFEKHILPEFGDIPCADLTAGRINAFINKKLADGLSASYVRDILCAVCRPDRRQDKHLYKQKARRRVICKLCEGYIYCFQNDAEICTGGIWVQVIAEKCRSTQSRKKAGREDQRYRTEKARFLSECKYVADCFRYPAVTFYGTAYW